MPFKMLYYFEAAESWSACKR